MPAFLPLHIAAIVLAGLLADCAPGPGDMPIRNGEVSSFATPTAHRVCRTLPTWLTHLQLPSVWPATSWCRDSGADVAALATVLTEELGSFPADYQPPGSQPD